MAIKHKLTVTLALLFAAAFVVGVFIMATDYQFSVHAPFRKIHKEMAETEVLALLGPPEARREITNPYDISYKITGYTFRAFKATGTILVYRGGRNVCYILLREGRVADYFVGYK